MFTSLQAGVTGDSMLVYVRLRWRESYSDIDQTVLATGLANVIKYMFASTAAYM